MALYYVASGLRVISTQIVKLFIVFLEGTVTNLAI